MRVIFEANPKGKKIGGKNYVCHIIFARVYYNIVFTFVCI